MLQDEIGDVDKKEILSKLIVRLSRFFPTNDGRISHVNKCCTEITLLRAIAAIFVKLPDSDKETEALKIAQLICFPIIANFVHIQNEIVTNKTTTYETSPSTDSSLHICDYLNVVASLLVDTLPFISPKIALNIFEQIFNHIMIHNDDAADLTQPSILLVHTLLTSGQLHNLDSQVLAYVFERVRSLLVTADIMAVHLLCSLVLPLLLTDVSRVNIMWSLIESVWAHQQTTEVRQLDMVLTLLCTLVHVFVSPLSPIVPLPPTVKSPPLRDVRGNKLLWEVVQCGISDSDPLSRKRSLFLINRVMLSLEGDDHTKNDGAAGESALEDATVTISSEGHVFWWDQNHKDTLHSLWEDVVLLLETLEVKQVS